MLSEVTKKELFRKLYDAAEDCRDCRQWDEGYERYSRLCGFYGEIVRELGLSEEYMEYKRSQE